MPNQLSTYGNYSEKKKKANTLSPTNIIHGGKYLVERFTYHRS